MILAFDIGGSFIKAAVSRSPDTLEIVEKQATPARDIDAFLQILRRKKLEIGSKPDAIAVSITGVVDVETDILTCANIPCLDGRKIVSDLGNALEAPVIVANDADCFALAEAHSGAGIDHQIVLGIILGSGVGGGVVVDGNLVNRGGFAGEWGHGPIIGGRDIRFGVDIPRYRCSCGQSGCINTIGGARGLEQLHELLHGETVDSMKIVKSFEEGDPGAGRTVELLTDLLSGPLALAVNITGASIVPAGGGLANSAMLLSKLDEKTRAGTLRKFARPLVTRAKSGPDAGLIGAVAMGWSACGDGRHTSGSLR